MKKLNPCSITTRFKGAETFESYCENVVPEFEFRDNVHEDIIKGFRVIKELLYYAYYEYEFFDVAEHRMMMFLEMALKIRYKELTGNEIHKLHGAIKWLLEHNHFEMLTSKQADVLNKVRNNKTHQKSYSMIGYLGLNTVTYFVDLINQIYNPKVEERKLRNEYLEILNKQLEDRIEKGVLLNLLPELELLYEGRVMFVDNISNSGKVTIYSYVKKVFELEDPNKMEGFVSDYFQAQIFKDVELSSIDTFFRDHFQFVTIAGSRQKQQLKSWHKLLKSNVHLKMYQDGCPFPFAQHVAEVRRKVNLF